MERNKPRSQKRRLTRKQEKPNLEESRKMIRKQENTKAAADALNQAREIQM